MSVDDLLDQARSRLKRLEPLEAAEAVERGAILVDTRAQFQREEQGEIPGAIVIERNHIEWRLDPTSSGRIPEATDADVHWILFCVEGYSSSLAAASLQDVGLPNATDLVGGYVAWKRAGLPTTAPGQTTPPRLSDH